MLCHLPGIDHNEETSPIPEKTPPYHGIHGPAEFAQVFKEILECYRWLYEGPKIMHHDISVNNLMFRKVDGKMYGILNDFDLAVFHENEDHSAPRSRTGTRRFMSLDLLVTNLPEHLYRHDLESFLYVLVYLTCRIEGSSLANWSDLEMERLGNHKSSALLMNEFPPQRSPFLVRTALLV
ncbi:hypothetical protein B0H19DRAFT_1375088 [Mycena capillaripes]|nr:hypothetical protein B0H19DRAFT_1375088 [Mycena capillaripes]